MRLIHYSYPDSYRHPGAAVGRSPWTGLESEIDRLFASAWSDVALGLGGGRIALDLYDDTNNAYVCAELPGLARADIQVEVVDGYLNLSATRKAKEDNHEVARELNRSIALPAEVAADKVAAAYENGVLTVTLPKKEEAKPRRIAVQVG